MAMGKELIDRERLEAACRAARSWGEVADAVGLVKGGSAIRTLRRLTDEAGIPISHLPGPGERKGPGPRWSDDELREAVAASQTYTGVVKRLRGVAGAASYVAVRVRIAELGLDDSHLDADRRKQRAAQSRARRTVKREIERDTRTWTDDDLRRAVAASNSLNGVFRHLGLKAGGEAWLTMQAHIRRLDIDTSHWQFPLERLRGSTGKGRGRSWTDSQLESAVAKSRSFAQVMREIGIAGGGSYRIVRRRIDELGLDTSHMRGQGWSSGMTNPPGGITPRPLDEILVRNSTAKNTSALRERLLAEGVLIARCALCGITDWHGRPAPLQLDHINGDRRDNRLENLRLLCANCHAHTDTWCSRNRAR